MTRSRLEPAAVPQASASLPRLKSVRRRWGFRLLAILLSLSPLFLFELGLRLMDWGHPLDVDDPWVELEGVRPLFEPHGSEYVIPESRQTYFRPERFPITKGERTFRIFCLGGSTVQGRPYATETSFTTWLEIALRTLAPDTDWEVINCGGVSYASYRLRPILTETLSYEPDLFIIYTGHNEFLEDRTYADARAASRLFAGTHLLLTNLRFYNVLRRGWLSVSSEPARRSKLPGEVDAILDYRGGLESYRRDDPWRDSVVAHFEFNLSAMARTATLAEVPVIWVNPACNLADSPPFKAEPSVSGDAFREFEQILSELDRDGVSSSQRLAGLRRLTELDPRHALAWYELGRALAAESRWEEAQQAWRCAKDEDVCPLRILEPMRATVRNVAAARGNSFIDAQGYFESLSRNGVTGNQWFVDHVHPSIAGHQKLALELTREMIRRDWLQVPSAAHGPNGPAGRGQEEWLPDVTTHFRSHLDGLDELYYAEGRRRLEGLRRWATGRVLKSPK